MVIILYKGLGNYISARPFGKLLVPNYNLLCVDREML